MWEEFIEATRARRSVRKFSEKQISEQDMNDVIDAGLVAPNSSNLQPWEFVWIRSPENKKRIIKACLNQSAARTAQEFVACIARWDRWDETRQEMADWLKTQPNIPKPVQMYYNGLAKTLYSQGPADIAGRMRNITSTFAGLNRPVPRGPNGREDMRVWAVKSTALACENMMLAAKAKGFDSCPMEGNDPLVVGDICGLKRSKWKKTWDVPMVISFGYSTDRGTWGAQWRRDRSKVVREI